MTLFESILNEQNYTNTKRIYYHGSNDPNLTKIAEDMWFFISTNLGYAMSYARRAGHAKVSALYKCHITEKLNIFNARSEKDYNFLLPKLTEFIEENSKIYDKKEVPDPHRYADQVAKEMLFDMKTDDWFDVIDRAIESHVDFVTLPSRANIIELLEQHYDGFYNYENNHVTHAEGSAVCIFEGKTGAVQLLQKAIVKWRKDEGTMKFYGDGWIPISQKVKNQVRRKDEGGINKILEKVLYRGYRDYPLTHDIAKPNMDSKFLFTAEDSELAMAFAIGETTKGDNAVFEVYDLPEIKDDDFVDITHDKTIDADDVQAYSAMKGKSKENKEVEEWINSMKDEYVGYQNMHSLVHHDDDDMPGHNRLSNRSKEFVFFNKDQFKPTTKVISKGESFSNKELKQLADAGVKAADKELSQREYEEQRPEAPGEREYYADMERQQAEDNEEELKRQKANSQRRDEERYGQDQLFYNEDYLTKHPEEMKNPMDVFKYDKGPDRDLYESILYENVLNEILAPIKSIDGKGNRFKFGNKVIDLLDANEELVRKLKAIKGNKGWEYVGQSENADARNLVHQAISDNDKDSYLIVNEDEDIIGIISLYVNYDSLPKEDMRYFNKLSPDCNHISEIALVGFKENSITMVKDVLNLLEDSFANYDCVRWTVKNTNKIKKAYVKKVTRDWGGVCVEGRTDTAFLISNNLKKEYRGTIQYPNKPQPKPKSGTAQIPEGLSRDELQKWLTDHYDEI